ncbi:sensor histidine kinase [Gaopeijia maritima]|uniref:sensor histidine kinase n=1 Tax=Gaopeijia maritima TaxID=3119007 RepID=UPI003870948F
MVRITSFRSRVFAALLAVAVVPAALALVGGVLALREVGSTTGTLGAWTEVAESGRTLVDAARAAAPGDTAVERAAIAHTEALSASVRQSRLYAVVTERAVQLLPWAAATAILFLILLSALVARRLSRTFSAPVSELVGWTELIAAGDPLPPSDRDDTGVREYRALRRAFRTGAERLEVARRQQVESARLRAWTEMARRVAHEIKNPLTPMRMSASTLARSDDPSVRHAAEMLLEEVARLDAMARTFARFGRPPESPPADVDLEELSRGIVQGFDAGGVTVTLQASHEVPHIHGHYDVIGQALRNLLVNAVEAVIEGGGSRIEVRLDSTDDEVRIAVRDDGPGIPTEMLEQIWLPDITTRHRGSGLGLAMVRRAAEIHGGTARAWNRIEGGAEFELRLPRTLADEGA